MQITTIDLLWVIWSTEQRFKLDNWVTLSLFLSHRTRERKSDNWSKFSLKGLQHLERPLVYLRHKVYLGLEKKILRGEDLLSWDNRPDCENSQPSKLSEKLLNMRSGFMQLSSIWMHEHVEIHPVLLSSLLARGYHHHQYLTLLKFLWGFYERAQGTIAKVPKLRSICMWRRTSF